MAHDNGCRGGALKADCRALKLAVGTARALRASPANHRTECHQIMTATSWGVCSDAWPELGVVAVEVVANTFCAENLHALAKCQRTLAILHEVVISSPRVHKHDSEARCSKP